MIYTSVKTWRTEMLCTGPDPSPETILGIQARAISVSSQSHFVIPGTEKVILTIIISYLDYCNCLVCN